MTIFEQILKARGLDNEAAKLFFEPDYQMRHDPFLLPDMGAAVSRLVEARERQEHITIYGDYDIDGLTATTVLLDAFSSFDFRFVDAFNPNRFREGYGMTEQAVEEIAATGATLIVTVDCGSLSEGPIMRAKELGVDVIVTDHHNVAPVQPPAVAVINPKRLLQDYPDRYEKFRLVEQVDGESLYPFLDLPGVGVAFKLVQALQTQLDGLEIGQEKWLLDLVALGTVCDVVTLVDENRLHVYWGLKVLAKTRRPGLKALMGVAGAEPSHLTARTLGFGLGPRMNAAGRLETAKYAQDMLLATDGMIALELAQKLDEFNVARRKAQDIIYKAALEQAEQYQEDSVLVLSHAEWSHGIIGIVAAKILERYKKPTYVFQELGDESKGSARSYGDFSVADAIRASDDIITKGGGHKLAAGVTLPTQNIDAFRQRVNEYFVSLNLPPQISLLLPSADVTADDFSEATEELVTELSRLEPYGSGNPEPIICFENVTVMDVRRMGSESQHVKLSLQDTNDKKLDVVAFSAPEEWFAEVGRQVSVWVELSLNEWRGVRSVQGRLLHLVYLPEL
ncbi:MAG TPA: DHHA1 domain-containing protein [Candidatus Saccharimonadales bacterium]|nr:DHHA1 domain-containing protein [Candidatus Saccharimonadales bacterium]